MSYNLFPSFKAIRYFERMTNISFLEIENHPELVLQLLYCCLFAHPENKFRMTYEEAEESFFPKHAEELVLAFSTEMNIINQFNREDETSSDDSSINSEEKSSPKEKENMFLSSLIPLLIINCHLDTNFVLNEMDYTDTKMYLESSVEHQHEEMENQRFWTYLQIAPHLGSKSKIKEAKDLVEFTWEKEHKKEEAEKKMKTDRQRLIELGIIKEDTEQKDSSISEGTE